MKGAFQKKQKINYSDICRSRTGFGLLEVIVAIFIIVIGLVGVLTLLSKAILSFSTSASRLIAANLAQEGIEVTRSIRDFGFGADSWDSWYDSVTGTSDYLVQYNDAAFRYFSDTPLLYDSVTGLYGYTAGSATKFNFKRKITLTKISSAEIKVSAEVTWTENNQNHTLSVEDRLWNWR